MNIFYLDSDPVVAAQYHCDKHVVKMIVESAQMLSTAVQANAKERLEDLYKPAYPKHPMNIWVGHPRQNFIWALENAVFISQEYYKRFNKLHKSSTILNIILDKNYSNKIIKQMHPDYITEPPQCMPDIYKTQCSIDAYWDYYISEKSHIAGKNETKYC